MTTARDGIAFETDEHAYITGMVTSALQDARSLLGWAVTAVRDDDGNYTDAIELRGPGGRHYLAIVRPVDDEAAGS